MIPQLIWVVKLSHVLAYPSLEMAVASIRSWYTHSLSKTTPSSYRAMSPHRLVMAPHSLRSRLENLILQSCGAKLYEPEALASGDQSGQKLPGLRFSVAPPRQCGLDLWYVGRHFKEGDNDVERD